MRATSLERGWSIEIKKKYTAVCERLAKAQGSIGVFVVCADTEAEARRLAASRDLWRLRQRQGILGRRSQQMKRQTLRGFLANSGEMFQLIDEAFDGSGKIRHAACVA